MAYGMTALVLADRKHLADCSRTRDKKEPLSRVLSLRAAFKIK